MVTYKALREPPRRLIDQWMSMDWCTIDLGVDQTIVLYKLKCCSFGTEGPMVLYSDSSFIRKADRPMVPYVVPCTSFTGSVHRWSYIVHLWGHSTDGHLLHTSPPSLFRWTGRLHMADGPMGHTVHKPPQPWAMMKVEREGLQRMYCR